MPDVVITIDSEIEMAPHAQIEEQLRAYIERGDLKPGDPLPTVRQLAGDLRVAPNTVARAYGDLQTDGWIVGEGRRGTFVGQRLPSRRGQRSRLAMLAEAVAEFTTKLRQRGYTPDEICKALGEGALHER